MKVAIHTVFIAKENILFLEEWLDYHIQLGFGPFYLYDNSKVERKSQFDMPNRNLVPQKVNKHGVNYDETVPLNQEQIAAILAAIADRYGGLVNFIEWSPHDATGAVCYEQEKAHNDCLARLRLTDVGWCASIDMDEFIVLHTDYTDIGRYLLQLPHDVHAVYMSQVIFGSRFRYIGKSIVTIREGPETQVPLNHSNKYLYRVQATTRLGIHDCRGIGQSIGAPMDRLRFNHYKSFSRKLHAIGSGISPQLIERISANFKNQIVHKYLQTSE